MITLFRRIRERLIASGSITKYLLYAIGEILLVVIGILIALQVNNWNENKKNVEAINNTIDELERELLNNYVEANSVLEFWTLQDSISKQVIFDELTVDDYKENDLISIVAVNWRRYTPDVENLTLLLENEKIADKSLSPIFSSSKILQTRVKNLEEQWSVLRGNLEDNLETLTSEVSLVRADRSSRDQKVQYMLNEESYKRLVELNWIHYEVYYDYISRYRAQAIALLSTIKTVQEGYSQNELEALYATIGLNEFEKLNCEQTSIDKNDEIRRGYVIGNLSEEIVTLTVFNDGKEGGSYTLLPKQFRYTRPEYAGLDGDYTVIAVQNDSSGNCISKYAAVNKGYLIID